MVPASTDGKSASDVLRAWLGKGRPCGCSMAARPGARRIPPGSPGLTRHGDVLAGLVTTHELRGKLVTDAHLAALALEQGLGVCSADTDFPPLHQGPLGKPHVLVDP